ESTSANARADLDETQKRDVPAVAIAAKKAAADNAAESSQIAQDAYEAAEVKAAETAGKAAAAGEAASDKATALALLDASTKAHDAAQQQVDADADAARKAGAAFDDAQT